MDRALSSVLTPLTGSRCSQCRAVAYPAVRHCPGCGSEAPELVRLSSSGRLWTFTIQRFPPKSPPYRLPAKGFTPFGVGYVELDEGVRIEAVLDIDLAALAIGLPVQLGIAGGVPRARLREAA